MCRRVNGINITNNTKQRADQNGIVQNDDSSIWNEQMKKMRIQKKTVYVRGKFWIYEWLVVSCTTMGRMKRQKWRKIMATILSMKQNFEWAYGRQRKSICVSDSCYKIHPEAEWTDSLSLSHSLILKMYIFTRFFLASLHSNGISNESVFIWNILWKMKQKKISFTNKMRTKEEEAERKKNGRKNGNKNKLFESVFHLMGFCFLLFDPFAES